MAFADDFREAVVPRLREAAKAQAFFVALDLIDLEDARNVLSAEASKAGSGLLKPADQDRLAEWIANLLWKESDKAHDRVVVLRSRAETAERADPVRYYEGLADRCSKPDAMRWTFAAIAPAYRKYLVGERSSARKA